MSLVLCGSNTLNKRLEILLQKVSAGGVVFEKVEKPLFSCKIRHLGVPPADEKPKADVYVGERADWTKPKKMLGLIFGQNFKRDEENVIKYVTRRVKEPTCAECPGGKKRGK